MNIAFSRMTIRGSVLDVGGGRNPDYFEYFTTESTSIEAIDASLTGIDFETDTLPYPSGSTTTVLLVNVLEHVYHYRFLLTEIARVLANDGILVGFVPFWVGYHPDPHDYFRYTAEALQRILAESGYVDIQIEPLAVGPILANFNTIVLSLPKPIRPVAYLWYACANRLFVGLRPKSGERNPLGYVFTARRTAHA